MYTMHDAQYIIKQTEYTQNIFSLKKKTKLQQKT
jgi:hypothetical protein